MISATDHFGIELIGDHYEVLMGRSMAFQGAHCRADGMNHRSLGVCIVGNFDKNMPNPGAWDMASELCMTLVRLTGLSPSDIIGHREAGLLDEYDWTKGEFKSCPGKNFSMDSFRRSVETKGDFRLPLWR